MPENPIGIATGITEQELHSIKFSQNAKGEISYEIKIYFKDGCDIETLKKIKSIREKLEEFKNIGGPKSF